VDSDTPRHVVIVAIVSYGRQEDVVACLSALARSNFAAFEVVVVENAGPTAFDQLAATLEAIWPAADPGMAAASPLAAPERAGGACVRWCRFWLNNRQPLLVVEASGNLGYGGGVNVVIQCVGNVTGWRGVWILNPDTEPDPMALQIVAEYAERGGYGLVGCRLVSAAQDRIQMRGGRWRWLIGRGLALGYGEEADSPADVGAIERRLQWVSGAALYATREFVEAVGPMNEKYFLYGEDVDWALRRGQFRLGYAHDAVVHHAHGTTIGSASNIRSRSNLSVYLTERNSLLLTREWFPVLYPFVALATLVLTLDYLVRGNRRLFATACRGWWGGLRGETGQPKGPL